MVKVLALTEHINAGVRRHEGESFEVADDRVGPLTASGLVVTERSFNDPWLRSESGRILTPFTTSLYKASSSKSMRHKVLQLTFYDPGCAAYRYHSAFNSAPGVHSRFARFLHSNPACDLRQYDGDTERGKVEYAFMSADVVHVHMDYRTLYHALGRLPEKHQVLVRHYHGSILPGDASRTLVENELDEKHEAVQVGARLYHLAFSEKMKWLPIPMPVRDYALLAKKMALPLDGRPFRIAHSPTVRALKGSDHLETVVSELAREGYDIELVLIENMEHGAALTLKASCDMTFDSFWLGIQGSGLEAACMGQIVVAGDPSARNDYIKYLGECPYTYAPERDTLKTVIAKAIDDPTWRATEAERVHNYVVKYHAYEAVATRYCQILDVALEERRVASHG